MTSSGWLSRVAEEIWVQALIYSSPDDELRVCTSVVSTVPAGAGEGVPTSVKKKKREGTRAEKGGNSRGGGWHPRRLKAKEG